MAVYIEKWCTPYILIHLYTKLLHTQFINILKIGLSKNKAKQQTIF